MHLIQETMEGPVVTISVLILRGIVSGRRPAFKNAAI